MKLGIIVIGYNRIKSLNRLLDSLSMADYESDKVDLIISIDNSGTNEVEDFAKKFVWRYGDKTVKTYAQRLGLRQHILTCGDYVYDFDAVAVFEDDIYVAPTFYTFMKQAVEFYKNDRNIAGISLYSHYWSEFNRRPFTPEKTEYDNYFLQYAQSWGQIWLPNQWKEFKSWYEKNSGEIALDDRTPSHITEWPKSSWLKYHIKYCIDRDKYFVYPYISYSTNYVEIGQHCKTSNTVYQVPMVYGHFGNYHFAKFGDEKVPYYDAFFERKISSEHFGVSGVIEIDLYGNKPIQKDAKYLVSSKRINKKIVKQYGLQLRPQEMNLLLDIQGNDLFLYDLDETVEKQDNMSDFDLIRWYYDSRVFDYKYIVRVLGKVIKSKLFK